MGKGLTMDLEKLISGLQGLNAPNQGMRYHSGGLVKDGPRFDEQTGQPLTPEYRSAELTLHGSRAQFIYELIKHSEALASALRPQAGAGVVDGAAVAEAYRKGAMAALGCEIWDDADDFFSLVGLDYAAGRPLPPTMPKPVTLPAGGAETDHIGDANELVPAGGVAGWKLVPAEPTGKQLHEIKSWLQFLGGMDDPPSVRNIYRAVLSAAPLPQVEGSGE